MSNLIFLGAGASRAFGIPTMQEMVTDFEEILSTDDKECFEFYSQIKNTLVEKYGPKNVDIESILSVLNGIVSQITAKELGPYAYYHIQKFCKSHNISYPDGRPVDEYLDKAKKTESMLKKYIRTSCNVTLSNGERNEVYKKSYLPFFSIIEGKQRVYPNHKLTVNWKAYTTNYDDIFEGFWKAFEPLNTHFVKEQSSNNYFLSLNELPDHSFCKLHGSLDWTQEKETGRIIREQTSGYSIYDTEGDVMLFPIQQKDLYLHPWFTLFSDLRKGLQNQQYWYVIGYSFNDEFIRNVFQEILAYNSNKKLIIINPNAEDIIYKFPESIRSQIDTVPIKFGGDFFALQFQDYFDGVKTMKIRFDTTSNKIRILSNHDIISAWIEDDCKVQLRKGNEVLGEDSRLGNISGNHKTAHFPIHNPQKLEVKIVIKIKYSNDDKLELRFTDFTKNVNFGIDYGAKMIASSHDIGNEYEYVENIPWTKYPITLDKTKFQL